MMTIEEALKPLKAYVNRIKSVESGQISDKVFRQVLIDGLKLMNIPDRMVAHEFGASRPTISRWVRGHNAPHQAMRKPVFKWLMLMAELDIKAVKGNS